MGSELLKKFSSFVYLSSPFQNLNAFQIQFLALFRAEVLNCTLDDVFSLVKMLVIDKPIDCG